MNSKKGSIIVTMSLCLFFISRGQNAINTSDFTKPTQILPPAPNAASLGKYGGINVGLSTGTPNINIPIYTFTSTNLKLPISLSYTSSGYKVDEIASRVGMGWVLNAGGVITRTVRGCIDEKARRTIPLVSPAGHEMIETMSLWTGEGPVTGAAGPYGTYDDQPDIFYFNFNGYSGSFILDSSRVINGYPSMQPILLNHSGLKVMRRGSLTDDFSDFKIITVDGVQYFFSAIDYTTTHNAAQHSNNDNCGYVYEDNIPTAWYLDKIVHPNNDTIYLSYTRAKYNYVTGISETIYQIDPLTLNQAFVGSETQPNPVLLNTICGTELDTDGVLLDEITSTAGGKVKFGYTNRYDCNDKLISLIEAYLPGKTEAYKIFDLNYVKNSITSFLSSFSERSTDHSLQRTHSFSYNDQYPLPARLSYSRDHWGYYNGKVNSTMIPRSENNEFQFYLPQATANREPDPKYCQNGLLSSIIYPTGGKDSILYEGNVGNVNVKVTPAPQTLSITGGTYAGSQSYYSGYFTISFAQLVTVSGYRAPTDQEDSTMSYTDMILLDASNNQVLLTSISQPNVYSGNGNVVLQPGTYRLKMDIAGNNPSAGASVSYMPGNITYQIQTKFVGGVRIAKTITYDNLTKVLSVKKYLYSIASAQTPPLYEKIHLVNYINPDHLNAIECRTTLTYKFFSMYSNTVHDTYSFSSPVTYDTVTEIFGENFENGGIEHRFSVVPNNQPAQLYGTILLGVPSSSQSNRNGKELYSFAFKKNGDTRIPVQKVFTHYKDDLSMAASYRAYVANRRFVWPCPVQSEPLPVEWTAFDCMTYYYYRSWIYADTIKVQTFNSDGQTYVEQIEAIEYANKDHALPTKTTTYSSEGKPIVTNNYYPPDLGLSGNLEIARQALLNKHIFSPKLQQQVLKDGIQTLNFITDFGIFSQGLVLPQSHSLQIGSNPLEKRIEFYRYTVNGQIAEQAKINDIKQSYIWDYHSLYPVAEVKNADNNSIAYTSFEADGTGNWSIGNGHLDPNIAITGTSAYVLDGTISKFNLNSSVTYIVSYWTQNGSPLSIPGTVGNPARGKTIRGWTLYVHKVTGQSTIAVNGTGHIDELRLYPATAQMTTYTYLPLTGMSSACDVGNRVTYYEYDGFQRLKRIRDEDQNILKTYDYQYQYAGCGTNCYAIPMQTLAGANTLGYPVGVFSIQGKLLGNASGPADYVNLWNSDADDAGLGTLSTGSDALHFNMLLNAGKTLPAGVTGCRYYQYDLSWNQLDAARNFNAAYIDFGDGTGMRMGKTPTDTPSVIAPNTTYRAGSDGAVFPSYSLSLYYVHTYPDASQKTITFYHNDANETAGLDNVTSPATCLSKIQNLRGNLPQNTTFVGGSSYQQANANTVANISNWNSIQSVTTFTLNTGDGGKTVHANLNFTKDFMQNNRNLQLIWLGNNYYYAGYYDPSFKISTLKSDWNTYFTKLQAISMTDDQWTREDLSGLKSLRWFEFAAANQLHSNISISNPVVPLPASVVDNILNQIAAGSGQNVTKGTIIILAGGTLRTSGSDAAVNLLKSKSWRIYINSIQL